MKGQIRRRLVSTKEIHVVGEGCSTVEDVYGPGIGYTLRKRWTGRGGLKEGEGNFCYWPS
jgi:hypothetical protein